MASLDHPALVVLAALAVFPVAGAGPAGAGAPTTVDSCTVISEPGTYVLTTGIDNAGKTPISEACFEIVADDVTFDGAGHPVAGRGESHTRGIAVVAAENVTIRNVSVDDWHYGVLVDNGSASVRDVRSFSNAYGVRFENATGGSVRASSLEDNLVGIDVDAPGVDLADNRFSGNEIRVRGDNATTAGSGSNRRGFV